MTMARHKKLFFLGILFMLYPLRLFALDRQIALFPFWGDNEEIAAMFGEVLYAALTEREGFDPVSIDMTRLPAGVPQGGLAPSVSPSPMLPWGVPFAITGSVYPHEAGSWLLRLYLWRASGIRPLINDDLVASDRESASMIIPHMLDWLLEWVDRDRPVELLPGAQVAIIDGQQVILHHGGRGRRHLENNWLYAGLRVGGNMQMFFPLWSNDGPDEARLGNISFVAHAHGQFFNPLDFLFLGVQVESMVTLDFDYNALSFMFPIMGRVTARRENSHIALLVGPYLLLPVDTYGRGVTHVAHVDDRFLGNTGWGYTLGLNLGTKVGPGFLNLGVRWSNDMFSSRRTATNVFYNRRMITIYIGYELGFFRKRN